MLGAAGMKKSIAIVITVDTKEQEARFLHELIQANGFNAPVIDVSTRNVHHGNVAFSSEEVCHFCNTEFKNLSSLRRDEMMKTMGTGAGRILVDLYKQGELAEVLALGGNQGTAIASIAMRALPIGVPKVIVSTVASGNIRPYVEYKDIAMMFSVADILGGVNTVSRCILTSAAGAVMGMAQYGKPFRQGEKPVIAITAFGNTDAGVNQARIALENRGYEVIAFHASGAGGSAMEDLIQQGVIQGVLDLTTHELVGEVHGDDIYAPLKPRLVAAGERGIPQVIAPGALEYFCFGAADTIPGKYRNRKIHYHNPYNTNVRASIDEIQKCAEVMAEKLNMAKGPVTVMLPLKGFSENGRSGGALFEPETDEACIEMLQRRLKPDIKVIQMDANINDEIFAISAADTMHLLMQQSTIIGN